MPEELISEMKNEEVPVERLPGQERGVGVPEQKESGSETSPERREAKYAEILKRVSAADSSALLPTADVALDAKSIAETLDEESKIQKLLDLASTKGVVHAVSVARHLNDFYALDRMHDALADTLYETLLAHGMIHKD